MQQEAVILWNLIFCATSLGASLDPGNYAGTWGVDLGERVWERVAPHLGSLSHVAWASKTNIRRVSTADVVGAKTLFERRASAIHSVVRFPVSRRA